MTTKRRHRPQVGSSALIIGVVIAGLIGLAYLANNIIGSQAALPSIQQDTDQSSIGNITVDDSDIPRLPEVSPVAACQALLDEAKAKLAQDPQFQRLTAQYYYYLQQIAGLEAHLQYLRTHGGSLAEIARIEQKIREARANLQLTKNFMHIRIALIATRYFACVRSYSDSPSASSTSPKSSGTTR